jgi:hypothetical protein
VSRREQYIVFAWFLVAAVVLALGSKLSPGTSIKVPAASTEDVPPFTPPPGAPMMHHADHVGPYNLIYTPHRYPAACGSEITTLIHRGYHTMALPAEGDMTWLSAAPGEADL